MNIIGHYPYRSIVRFSLHFGGSMVMGFQIRACSPSVIGCYVIF